MSIFEREKEFHANNVNMNNNSKSTNNNANKFILSLLAKLKKRSEKLFSPCETLLLLKNLLRRSHMNAAETMKKKKKKYNLNNELRLDGFWIVFRFSSKWNLCSEPKIFFLCVAFFMISFMILKLTWTNEP